MTKKKRAKARKRRTIAFQGEPGANSHIACKQAYPDYEPLACATFEDAFAAVRSGRATLAMIPIDNSVAGRVADIHHLMPVSQLHIVPNGFCRFSISSWRRAGRHCGPSRRSRVTFTRSVNAAT